MEFRILGPLEVWNEGCQVAIPGERQRAVLALLLLHANEVVSIDRFIDELWEEPPASGAKALRVRISQLRKALPGGVLETLAPGYRLRVGRDELDLHRFEQLAEEGRRALDVGDAAGAGALLREALAVWRGPALADFAYQRFAQAAIGRLEEVRLAVLELRVDADLVLGRHAEVVGELEELIDAQPLRERPRGQLMLALYRSARQAEALEVYQCARRVLVDELGIEPGPALQELERRILQHDPSLDLPRAEPAPVSMPGERSILAAVSDEANVDPLLAVAQALALRPARALVLARVVANEARLGASSAWLQEHRAALEAHGTTARAASFTSAVPGEDLARLASELAVDLLLTDAPAGLLADGVPDEQLALLLANTPCDVAVLVPRATSSEGAVLVPFGGAEHDWAAVELGAWLARALAVPLRLAGAAAMPDRGRRDASRLLSHASLAVQQVLGVHAEPLLVAPGDEGVLEASSDAGLLVVGLSTRWHREGLGRARLRVAREAPPTTLFVRRGLRPGGLAPPAALTRFTWSIRS